MITSIASARFATTIVVLAGILAGCAGGGSPNPATNGLPGSTQLQSQSLGMGPDMCPYDNGVSVHPCHVTLTSSNPSVTVHVTIPRHDRDGTISVQDRGCRLRNIASISGSGNTFTVSAGSRDGTCTAKFVYKEAGAGIVGTATLDIINHD